jgi:integrase
VSRYRKGKIFEFEGMWIDRVPGSAFWYAFRYDRDAGKVRRETLGSDDLEEAKRVLVQKALVAAPKKPDSSLAAILTTYFQEVSDAKPSGKQARFAGRTILRFWGDDARASDVNKKTQKAFAEWSRDQDHSAAYIARNLSVLSASMRHALGADAPKLWTWAPTVAEKLGMPDPGIREWIPTNEQLAAFLDALDSAQAEHVFRYCILALNTLARPAAVLELTAAQVDHALELIDLNPQGRRQNKKRRPIVRVTSTLEAWLAAWDAGDPERPYVLHHGEPVGTVRHTFKRIGSALGAPEMTPYTLRHKVATELRARGVSREEIAYQMGHKMPDLRTTDRYTKFDKRNLANAKMGIEQYLAELDKLTKRSLLQPDTLKIFSTSDSASGLCGPLDHGKSFEISMLKVVGATGIEPVTPTMST